MQIDLVQRPDLLRGVCDARREGDGVVLDRMNAALREFYSDSEARIARAQSRPGVRIVFQANTRWVRIALRFGLQSRALFKSDLFCNGQHSCSFGPEEPAETWQEEFSFPTNGTGEMRFDIWLPHCVQTFVQSLEVEDGADVKAVPPAKKKWLAVGDSITQGMTATTPGRTYVCLAARETGLDLHDIGVGGGTAEPQIGLAARPIECDVITVLFGPNDFNRGKSADLFRQNTAHLIEALLDGRPGLPVGLMTPLPWMGCKGTNEAGASLADFRAVLRDVPGRFPSVRLIEGPDLVPAEDGCFVDGVHPNDAGMKSIGEGLVSPLRDMIETVRET